MILATEYINTSVIIVCCLLGVLVILCLYSVNCVLVLFFIHIYVIVFCDVVIVWNQSSLMITTLEHTNKFTDSWGRECGTRYTNSKLQWSLFKDAYSTFNRRSANRSFSLSDRLPTPAGANASPFSAAEASGLLPASGCAAELLPLVYSQVHKRTRNNDTTVLLIQHPKMDFDAPVSTWAPSPSWRPALTLIFDLWPPESNPVISRG